MPGTSTGLFDGVPTICASVGSVAIVTRYFVACGTGDQRSSSGSEGHWTLNSSDGPSSVGAVFHAFVSPRTRDHLPTRLFARDRPDAPEVVAVGDALVERRGGVPRPLQSPCPCRDRGRVELNFAVVGELKLVLRRALHGAPGERRHRLDGGRGGRLPVGAGARSAACAEATPTVRPREHARSPRRSRPSFRARSQPHTTCTPSLVCSAIARHIRVARRVGRIGARLVLDQGPVVAPDDLAGVSPRRSRGTAGRSA